MILPLYRRQPTPRPELPEIETTVAQCHSLLAGGCVAGWVFDRCGRRQLVVVAEMSRRLHRVYELDLTGEDHPLIEEVKAAIRNAVATKHRVRIDRIILTPRHSAVGRPLQTV
jgi:hypothetical protein